MPAALERTFVKDGKTVVTTDSSTASWLIGQGWTEQGTGTTYIPPMTQQRIEDRIAALEAADATTGWGAWIDILNTCSPHANLSILNSTYGRPEYRVSKDGTQVQLRGVVKINAPAFSSGQWVWTMPAAARPSLSRITHAGCDANSVQQDMRYDVSHTNGAVAFHLGGGGNWPACNVFLDGSGYSR